MSGEVRVLRVAPQPVAVVRRSAPRAQLPQVMPAALGVVWNWVRARPDVRPGRNLAIYDDLVFNFAAGVEVAEPFDDDGEIVCAATPGGLVATITHWGDYARLGESYRVLHDWAKAEGRTLGWPFWEVYGHMTDDPSAVRTDICYRLPAADVTAP